VNFPKEFSAAVSLLAELPSIGPRAAERIMLYLLNKSPDKISALSDALKDAASCRFCKRCFNISSREYCTICEDNSRDQKTICVVEDILDLMAIEKKEIYRGIYHVLGGSVRIGQKNNAHQLKISALKTRISQEKTREVIIATNPTTSGDMTAVFLKESLGRLPKLKITRISRGMPTGGDIEYADPDSIAGSFQGRREF